MSETPLPDRQQGERIAAPHEELGLFRSGEGVVPDLDGLKKRKILGDKTRRGGEGETVDVNPLEGLVKSQVENGNALTSNVLSNRQLLDGAVKTLHAPPFGQADVPVGATLFNHLLKRFRV